MSNVASEISPQWPQPVRQFPIDLDRNVVRDLLGFGRVFTAGRYQAILPTFISGWDGKALKARLAFGAPDQETLALPETALERRYALRAVKQRLHQASFREAVITAYNGRCALSGLPEPLSRRESARLILGDILVDKPNTISRG